MKTTTTTTREFDGDGRCIKEVTVVETETSTPERDDRLRPPYDPVSQGGHMEITPWHVYRTWNTAEHG